MNDEDQVTEPVGERLGYLFKRVQQALERELNRQLRTLNLSIAQYAALAALEEQPGLSNADLAERCFVTPQTMHQITARLERQRWLARSPHPDHGKIVKLTLTESGQRLLYDAHSLVLAVEKQLTAELGKGEQAQLRSILGTYLKALQTPL